MALGISGDEFRRRWYAGELIGALTDPHAPEHEAVQRLAAFVTADRPVGW